MAEIEHEIQEVKEIMLLGGLSFPELIRRVAREAYKDNCFGQASQLAYYFLLALFPFLLFLTTILGYLPLPNLMDYLMSMFIHVMPAEALSLVQNNLQELVAQPRGGLLSFGILMALYASANAVMAIMDNLNRAYNVHEGRPFWKVWGTALLLVMGLSFLIIIATSLLMFGPQIGGLIANFIGLGRVFEKFWNLLRWVISLFFLIFSMANIYYFGPDVEQKWKWITPGSIFSIVMWVIVSLGFSYYAGHFGSYNKVYGSIGTFIVLMTWMYLLGLAILIGGEINAEIEHAAKSGKRVGEKTLPETLDMKQTAS